MIWDEKFAKYILLDTEYIYIRDIFRIILVWKYYMVEFNRL